METSNEFAAERIPDSQLVAWPRVAAVAAMVSFSLPTFITGIEVSQGLTSVGAVVALFVGSLIVAVVGAMMGAIGASTRLSSYLLVRVAFGDVGAGVVNIAFAISLLGWFGININLFTDAVSGLALSVFDQTVPLFWLSVLASACMTVTTLVGFRAINILSVVLVPVLAIVTGLLAWSAVSAMSLSDFLAVEQEARISTGDGVSAIVGAIIIGAIILPDITRFVRHWSGAVYTAIIAYVVVQLAVMIAASMAAVSSGKTDILEILLDANLGLGAFAIVIAGSWVLNSLNLYSAVLSTKASLTRLNAKWLTLALGAVGVAAALLNILDSFVTFLFYLSVIFIPVAGVIVADFAFVQRSAYQIESLDNNRAWNVPGFVAWSCGAVFAILASEAIVPPLTRIAAVDAVLISFVVYLALSWRGRAQRSNAA